MLKLEMKALHGGCSGIMHIVVVMIQNNVTASKIQNHAIFQLSCVTPSSSAY
jgi:hypothetical protein